MMRVMTINVFGAEGLGFKNRNRLRQKKKSEKTFAQ
jgi:hypothetical protein